MRRRATLPIEQASAGMVVARVVVRPPDVVFVKGILEASEGIAALFAERGGELTLAAPPERRDELAELLGDLRDELGAFVEPLGCGDSLASEHMLAVGVAARHAPVGSDGASS